MKPLSIALLLALHAALVSQSATYGHHDYCYINDMQKYCPPCPRTCGINKCGCTCPITKEQILPRSSNPLRPPYCANCPVCFQLKVKCPNPLPLCTANAIRDLIAF